MRFIRSWALAVLAAVDALLPQPARAEARAVAVELDRLLMLAAARERQDESAAPAPEAACSDEDFLRRVSLDLRGTLPSPRDVTCRICSVRSASRWAWIRGTKTSARWAGR